VHDDAVAAAGQNAHRKIGDVGRHCNIGAHHRKGGGGEDAVELERAMIVRLAGEILEALGLFRAALTGPGRVWLQTLPISKLAHALREYLPSGGEQRIRRQCTGDSLPHHAPVHLATASYWLMIVPGSASSSILRTGRRAARPPSPAVRTTA
jgi:hypothetical protein